MPTNPISFIILRVMKSSLSIFGLFLLLSMVSCGVSEPELCVYGAWGRASVHKATSIIPLDEYSDYSALLSRIRETQLGGDVPVIELHDGQEIVHVWLHNIHPHTGCVLIKERNVLNILDDKIRREYDMDKLEWIYEEIYLNKEQLHVYSRNPDEVVVRITYDKKEMTRLKEIILRIVRKFEEMKVSNDFSMMIEAPIPPPPPPLIQIKSLALPNHSK